MAADLRRVHDPESLVVDPMKLKLVEVLTLLFMVLIFGVLIWKFFH